MKQFSRFTTALTIGALLAALALAPTQGAEAQGGLGADGLVVHRSNQSFEATWNSLVAALDANPNIRIIGAIDHAQAAADAGLSLEPNRVVFFGNPALGSPIMATARSAALDLPQKMQVYQQGTRVYIAYNPTSYLAQRHGAGSAPTLATIDGALRNLASTAVQGEVGAGTATHVAFASGLSTTASANDFGTTWRQLLAAIDRSPAKVAFTIDHGANSGGAIGPTALVVFGNPQIGTPLMADTPTAGIDLPLKMVVWVDDHGVTQVSSTDPAWIQQRHGLGPVPTLNNAAGAIANFTAAATAPAHTSPLPHVGSTAEARKVVHATAPTFATSAPLAHTGSDVSFALAGLALVGLGGACLIGARRRRD